MLIVSAYEVNILLFSCNANTRAEILYELFMQGLGTHITDLNIGKSFIYTTKMRMSSVVSTLSFAKFW
jgi:hypothetical protein